MLLLLHFLVYQKTDLGRCASMDGGIMGENPIREISVLQYLKANGSHPNVIDVIEVGCVNIHATTACAIDPEDIINKQWRVEGLLL